VFYEALAKAGLIHIRINDLGLRKGKTCPLYVGVVQNWKFFKVPGTILRRDVGEESEPFRVSSASLPNSITRIAIELFSDRYSGEVPPVGHPALAGGIIYEQSAMKQSFPSAPL
jgi:hypothetical protein